MSSWDDRQRRRGIILERVILASKALAVLYLAAHAAIAWQAYHVSGLAAAAVTLVTLGFGDLYWALRWLHDGMIAHGAVALLTALACFASWLLRPLFNRWMTRFAADMLEDASEEIDRIAENIEERERKNDPDGPASRS